MHGTTTGNELNSRLIAIRIDCIYTELNCMILDKWSRVNEAAKALKIIQLDLVLPSIMPPLAPSPPLFHCNIFVKTIV